MLRAEHRDITLTCYDENDPTFMEEVPTSLTNGKTLTFMCRLMNSRFGQIFLSKTFMKDSLVHIVRNCICDHKVFCSRRFFAIKFTHVRFQPTFYPIKMIGSVECAKPSDIVDTKHLQNKFQDRSKWTPATMDYYRYSLPMPTTVD